MLQVDTNSDMTFLRTYYEQFYERLYDLVTNIYNLSNCIINYDTKTQKLELVDATFKTIFSIKGIVLIDCVIDGGSFVRCEVINSEVKNAHITNTTIEMSDIYNSKVESCRVGSG